ncbi:MAG: transketolase C-terminal domain-containing protein, partial [Planctomycetota bacterium]
AVRYPRGTVTERDLGPCPAFELGRSRPLFTPEHPVAAIVSYGTSGLDALEAAEALASEGMPVEVHDGRFAAPVDLQLLEDLARRELPVMTVEDHGLPGGFGAAIAEAASDAGLPLRLRRLGIPDQWIPCGSQSDQKKMAGIDADAIMTALRQLVANIPG